MPPSRAITDAEGRLPISRAGHGRGGNNRKLFEQHTAFLVNLWDNNAAITLAEARDELKSQFDITITLLSGLRKHVVKHCRVTLKKLEKLSAAARNSERIIELLRYEKVMASWRNQQLDLDYLTNCVFLDEAGFNLHLRRGFGWSKVGTTPAKAVVPTQKGVNITIMGAMCELGVIALQLRKPTVCMRVKDGKKVI